MNEEKVFKLTGSVINKNNGCGIAEITVEAYDKDLLFDDSLGKAVTDADGKFSMEVPAEGYRHLFVEELPDLYFKLYRTGESEPAWTTESSVIWNAKSPAAVNIELDLPVEVEQETEPKPEILQSRRGFHPVATFWEWFMSVVPEFKHSWRVV